MLTAVVHPTPRSCLFPAPDSTSRYDIFRKEMSKTFCLELFFKLCQRKSGGAASSRAAAGHGGTRGVGCAAHAIADREHAAWQVAPGSAQRLLRQLTCDHAGRIVGAQQRQRWWLAASDRGQDHTARWLMAEQSRFLHLVALVITDIICLQIQPFQCS